MINTSYENLIGKRKSCQECRNYGLCDDLSLKESQGKLYQLETITKDVDVLASWNFKHIVNLDRIKGYNSVNLRLGYAMIEIRSPKDLIRYEND
jgi:hypothetical protein